MRHKHNPDRGQVRPDTGPDRPSAAPGTTFNVNSFTATSASADTAATGGITFYEAETQTACPSEAATASWTSLATATTVNGNGQYIPGAGFTASTPGTYCWYASYGGDTNDTAAASAVETTTVRYTPSLTLAAPGTSTLGATIASNSITGTLSGAGSVQAGDTITFYVSNSTTDTSCPSLSTPGAWTRISRVN